MDIVTIVGLIFLGLIFVLSVFLGLKAYKDLSLKKSDDYYEDDNIKEKPEESSNLINISLDKHTNKSNKEQTINTSNSVISSAVISSNRTEKEERFHQSNSSLRNAAMSFNKKEHERERSIGNDGWNPMVNNLFATSLDENSNNDCEHKESIFNSDPSGFGGSFSTTHDSTFSSFSSDSNSYSVGSDSGGSCD